MKTIEQKAKAYDESVERAKVAYKDTDRHVKATIERIFPELCEYEDEKMVRFIANELVCLRASEDKGSCRYNELTSALSWLEKQKELLTPEEKMKHHLYVEGFEAGKQVGTQYEAVFGKQKEQKQEFISISEMVSKYRNTDEYDDDGNYKGKPVNCMIRAYEQGIRDTLLKVKEQKPAWSEEDGKLMRLIISILKNKLPDKFYRSDEMESGVYVEELVDFLENLRPSQKLTEDQIYTLERICSNLHLRASDDAPKLDEIIELLKQK